jgi:Tfp pilus assembly protein PilN
LAGLDAGYRWAMYIGGGTILLILIIVVIVLLVRR